MFNQPTLSSNYINLLFSEGGEEGGCVPLNSLLYYTSNKTLFRNKLSNEFDGKRLMSVTNVEGAINHKLSRRNKRNYSNLSDSQNAL